MEGKERGKEWSRKDRTGLRKGQREESRKEGRMCGCGVVRRNVGGWASEPVHLLKCRHYRHPFLKNMSVSPFRTDTLLKLF